MGEWLQVLWGCWEAKGLGREGHLLPFLIGFITCYEALAGAKMPRVSFSKRKVKNHVTELPCAALMGF